MSTKLLFVGSAAVAVAMAYGAAALHFHSVDPRAFFAAEPGVRQLAELSPAAPQVDLADLLEDDWDYACFVQPYHDVDADHVLSGVALPSAGHDGYVTVVLKRGTEHAVHRFGRDEISIFELTGLAAGEACYGSTALMVEFAGEDTAGFKTLRVTPR